MNYSSLVNYSKFTKYGLDLTLVTLLGAGDGAGDGQTYLIQWGREGKKEIFVTTRRGEGREGETVTPVSFINLADRLRLIIS